MITSTAKDSNSKVHPVHTLLGYVPNWFILGSVNEKPNYASLTLATGDFNFADSEVQSSGQGKKRAKPNRRPIRIQIVKTRYCTYVIER